MSTLTHFDEEGRARMVDVGHKDTTLREARARGWVHMKESTLRRIIDREVEKGDALAVAQLAGIMGAKHTSQLIPLCHPLRLTAIEVHLTPRPDRSAVLIEAKVKTRERTGVEMEALTAVSVAALTLYDMCKAVDRGMRITSIELVYKAGGKSGTWERPRPPITPPPSSDPADDADI